jgi:lipoprotein-anchoring transpeptidase ErfK/SrfK
VSVTVSFLRGEQPAAASRRGSGLEAALAHVLDGPTAAELRKGIRTELPEGVTLRRVEVENGVATVDLGAAFAAGKAADLPPRLSQIVLTATAVPGVKSVVVRVNGKTRQTLHPRIDLAKPLTAKMLGKPKGGPPAPKAKKKPAAKPSLRETELRLVELGFMEGANADGVRDAATHNAAMAFQKWAGIARDGVIGPQTLAALATAKHPTPRTKGPQGKRLEVLLDRQVALVIWNGTVTRVLHVSSGRPGYDTPTGTFHVERKFTKDWSVPYAVWLPWASYFVGGVAFHEAPDVPAYAASHGCVRVPHGDAEWLYRRIPVGTPVTVLQTSR